MRTRGAIEEDLKKQGATPMHWWERIQKKQNILIETNLDIRDLLMGISERLGSQEYKSFKQSGGYEDRGP